MALTGTYERNLDEKHRLALPKKLLDEFGQAELPSLYVAPGTNQSLSIYSPVGFDRLARRIARQAPSKAEVRDYVRLFYARAEKLDLDLQSRVRIPDRLVEFAGLSREIVLLGVNDHAEIWDAPKWAQFTAERNATFDEMANRAFEGM